MYFWLDIFVNNSQRLTCQWYETITKGLGGGGWGTNLICLVSKRTQYVFNQSKTSVGNQTIWNQNTDVSIVGLKSTASYTDNLTECALFPCFLLSSKRCKRNTAITNLGEALCFYDATLSAISNRFPYIFLGCHCLSLSAVLVPPHTTTPPFAFLAYRRPP